MLERSSFGGLTEFINGLRVPIAENFVSAISSALCMRDFAEELLREFLLPFPLSSVGAGRMRV